MRIDLNCDMGELPEVPESEIMPRITSANVACGSHAGDERTMEATLRLAMKHGVSCGAHPGYPDRENFGRKALALTVEEIAESVYEQVTALDRIAQRVGCEIRHVKPHGALYNVAACDPEVAIAVAEGVARWRFDVILVGLAGSPMLRAWREVGFSTAAEGFADRAYEPDGTLRPRSHGGALITDPEAAADQAVSLARGGQVETICVHSDTAGAVLILSAIRRRFEHERIDVTPLFG